MINFLQETIDALKEEGLSEKDVLWVGNNKEWMTWDDFSKIANFEYENGYGENKIESMFLIVGSDWWLEREEYEGKENWSFKKYPLLPFIKAAGLLRSATYNPDINPKEDWSFYFKRKQHER